MAQLNPPQSRIDYKEELREESTYMSLTDALTICYFLVSAGRSVHWQ